MRGAWSALLMFLATTAAAHLEPEAQEALHILKQRILSDLGMKRLPDIRAVNISSAQVQRMTRRYFNNVRRSEQELLTYRHKGYERDSYLLFKPEMELLSSLQWARLRFPNSSVVDVSVAVKRWREDSSEFLMLACGEPRCRKARLELLVRKARTKRAACNKECCKRSLKISFKEIGWDWIVQPVEFEAFYCKGRCRDVSDGFASTHALMQSILNYKGRKVSRPCCAPRKLRPLDLLHYNDKTPPELVVTRQKGMIVKECACA
ncbi:growth/differentiation factor 6-B-like [Stegodyphus dumicola]|uniref:growth/differentiation factor 6-B-like n=1 Tax=Stegodyphus dumicola TaxID=202533 RepID=UPI0015A87C36|nr:growth/differentiation factor 6-B-like [Stegodyphus dumicola]